MDKRIEKACEFLITKAFPVYDSNKCGHCAAAVRNAFDFGFGKQIKRFPSAKDCAPAYEEIGFKKISLENYKPEIGDISIIQYEPYGHICVFTQKGWVSDFIQRDMYGGKIREKKPSFAIYRL